MSSKKPLVEDLLFTLKQQRDELRVQMHLAGQEAKDELAELEKRYDKMTSDYDGVKGAVSETAENLFSSLEMVGEEIRDGFSRIAKQIRK